MRSADNCVFRCIGSFACVASSLDATEQQLSASVSLSASASRGRAGRVFSSHPRTSSPSTPALLPRPAAPVGRRSHPLPLSAPGGSAGAVRRGSRPAGGSVAFPLAPPAALAPPPTRREPRRPSPGSLHLPPLHSLASLAVVFAPPPQYVAVLSHLPPFCGILVYVRCYCNRAIVVAAWYRD